MNLIEILTWITGIVVAVGALIVAVLQAYKKAHTEIQTLPKRIKQQSVMDGLIIQHMEELKEKLNADRVQLYDFHNGGHYANGRSAIKTSCTYESTRAGVQGKQGILQNIPLSCIPKFINQLLDKGYMGVKDIEEMKDKMPATYDLKKSMDVTGFYDIVVNNRNYEPIGFLAVQYTKNPYAVRGERDRQEIYKLKVYVEDILAENIK